MEHLCIGIDIGGTNLRCALVGASGRILHRSRSSSAIGLGRQAFCARLLGEIDGMRAVATSCHGSVIALGAGVPGVLDRDGLIRSSVNMRPLDGFNLAAFLERETGLPAACGNDANVIALGEQMYGAGQGLASFIVISIGTGLGSGLILNGGLWTGAGGFASEFGHVTVEPRGLPCPCGNEGCLEQYSSAGAIVRSARELLPRRLLEGTGDTLDAARVAELARQGEAGALEAFASAGRYLGMALASLANTLNLEAAIIVGGVAPSLDLMLPSLRRELDRRCFQQMASAFAVMGGTLGDDAGLLGGAVLARTMLRNSG